MGAFRSGFHEAQAPAARSTRVARHGARRGPAHDRPRGGVRQGPAESRGRPGGRRDPRSGRASGASAHPRWSLPSKAQWERADGDEREERHVTGVKRFRGDSTGPPSARSWFIGHPERSTIGRDGLWTVPELWKTHTPRFPQARWTAQRTRRPHGPQGTLLCYFQKEERRTTTMTRLREADRQH